ncbi:immune inhibitor A domain-containing protein (plasmid) [Pseudoalteromonas sp. T1lg65]|uniref:immune inhibitor A domain-containing protein n=1 Tax=Pseudoalteromonas sp. T1lg65 TaxID=2077101 RepID=UPI003F7AAD48
MKPIHRALALGLCITSVTATAEVFNQERYFYWQEKRLGRELSDYEKQQLLNSLNFNGPEARVNPPLAIKAPTILNPKFKKQMTSPTLPGISEAKILAILVDFPDLPHNDNRLSVGDTDMFYSSYSTDHYQSLLFSNTGYNGPNNENLNSANQFYQQASGDSFSLSGQVIDWVRVSENAKYYGERTDNDNDIRPSELVFEAIQKAIEQNQIDLADYDKTDLFDLDGDGIIAESDGVIDHIMLFHSSIGEEAGGGVLGGDAIWSHRFFVFDDNYEPKAIPGTNYKAFNYTINPIDAAIGVVVHEFGHDLGLPDEYDLDNPVVGEPVSLWSVMSAGTYLGPLSGSAPNQFSPKNLDVLQTKLGGNWINQKTYALGELSQAKSTTLSDAGVNDSQVNQVKINLPGEIKDFVEPLNGDYHYYSGQGNGLISYAGFSITLPNSEDITLSMLANYSIQKDYDLFQIYVNNEPVAGNLTKDAHPTYNGVTNYIDGDSSASGENTVTLSFDLSTYKGQQINVFMAYFTDAQISHKGILLDDIKVTNGEQVLYSNDAEGTASLQYEGFRKISQYISGPQRDYYLQLRSHRGLDSGLQQYGYNTGLLLWYSNEAESNNSTSIHPGTGNMLVIDTDQRPIFKANGVSPAISQIQVRDAALRTTQQTAGLGDQDLSAISSFNDQNDYAFELQPESGVVLPKLGVAVTLNSVSEDASNANLTISHNYQPKIVTEQTGNVITFTVEGLVATELDSFNWSFGDGHNSRRISPTHTYAELGDYTVVFTHVTAQGRTKTASTDVTVTSLDSPALKINNILSQVNGPRAEFSISASGGVAPYSYSWSFGDGNSETGRSVANTYTLSGAYTVVVEVTDAGGTTITQSKQIDIEVPLAVSISNSTSDLSVTLSATGQGGDGNYTVTWDFGDGNTATGLTTSHRYQSAGTYEITATLTDKLGQTLTSTIDVTVTAPTTTTPETSSSTGSSGGAAYHLLWLMLFAGLRRKLN